MNVHPSNKMLPALESLYARIHSENYPKIAAGNETVDTHLDHLEGDGRRGLSLLITLDAALSRGIVALGDEIKAIEPDQYYYPESDLHVTVLDLISAHEGFALNERQVVTFIGLVERTIRGVAPFELQFRGVIVSGVGIVARGFYREGLHDIRIRLRELALAEGIDLKERYHTISAHATLMRFASAVTDRSRFLSVVDGCSNRDIGCMTVKEVSLVVHDWYNRDKEELGRFVVGR
jgi:2'-5' RNA ligase